jgi:two-component system sensor histidine kinase/response regulator
MSEAILIEPKTVEQRYPDVVPLVLSAQSDTNSVLDAVNKGHIYGYILKPWNNMELKLTVKQAIDVFNLQQEKRDLLSKLEEHNRLLDKRVRQRTKQLMAVQREAEIGRYSAQIVHNMNNPLQALYLWAERAEGLLSGNRCDLNELGEYISSIMSSANDLKTIVSSVLTHARNEDNSRTQMVNINDVIRKTLDFYKAHPIFKRQIEKQLKLSDELPPIVGNPIQIQQIMDNLVKNAVDAISAYR